MHKKLTENFEYKFDVSKSGIHAISIVASCNNEKRSGLQGGEDLKVEIDGIKLREIPAEKRSQYYDIPLTWNGTRLKGLSKTVIFIIELKAGKHILTFIPKGGAVLDKEPEINRIENPKKFTLNLNKQAQDGNRRPWVTLALVNLPLSILDVSVICNKRFLDSDDVKIIINHKIQKCKSGNWWAKNWFWHGRQLKGKTSTRRFHLNLNKSNHYIEFWADRMPTLNEVTMNLEKTKENEQHEEIKEENKIQKYDKFHGIGGKEDYNRFDNEIIEAVDYWNDFFQKQEYPPKELLDYNLVKAIIYKESRVGYERGGEIDVMQVGHKKDPALHTLNNDRWIDPTTDKVAREYEIQNGVEEVLDYGGEAQVKTIQNSIYWGVRWLYHKAQGITYSEKRYWRSWKDAILGYGPGTAEYVDYIWRIYKDGKDPHGNTLWEKVKEGFGMSLSLILIGMVFITGAATMTGYKINKGANDISQGDEEIASDVSNYGYKSLFNEPAEKSFLDGLEEYKKDQYYHGEVFKESVEICDNINAGNEHNCSIEYFAIDYFSEIVENTKSNKQFLDAMRYFDFLDPKVGDIDNDGENEIVFIREDIQNHEFIKILVIDKIIDKFYLIEKEIERLYSARIELRDLTNDIIPEIILYYNYGRWGNKMAVYQYEKGEFNQIFDNSEFIRPIFTLSDKNGNNRMEIKIEGEKFDMNPIGFECNVCPHMQAEEIYEYSLDKNNFQLISQKQFGLPGALNNILWEIVEQGPNHKLFARWSEKEKEDFRYSVENLAKEGPSGLFSDVIESSVQNNWWEAEKENDLQEIWIIVKRSIKPEDMPSRDGETSEEIETRLEYYYKSPFYKISFARNDSGDWMVTEMMPVQEEK
ncbi:hypothetical protein D4R87_02430 [bacterium]|nr:MAG: hypothetical protein D4R87_02430 [bacterium]